jgi:hypothetical protein
MRFRADWLDGEIVEAPVESVTVVIERLGVGCPWEIGWGLRYWIAAFGCIRAIQDAALVSPPLSTTGVVTSEGGDDAKEGDSDEDSH